MKKWMKATVLLMVVSMFAMLLGACGSSSKSGAAKSEGNTLEQVKKKGVLVVGSSNDAPFAFIDKDTKEFTGIDAEIIKEIAKRLGIKKVEMKEIKFENLLLELNKKSVDLVTDGMYVKPEREKVAKFTDIWYKEGEAILVGKDSTVKSVDDLKGKVVGAQKGQSFLELAQKWKSEGKVKDVKIFGGQSELMLAIKTKKVDAVVGDGALAAYAIKTDKSLGIKMVSPYTPVDAGKIAAAGRKNDTSLVDAVNKELAAMKEDGTVLKILEKYGLSKDYYFPGKN
ncbi:transporter substrate-binding domain-containing protein [Terrilactibacillus sp. BCM23-1]|uniref:Transporter substrate-binding domain-containing protein n=1 Tax=Terrilactibacillus tamarindi TaxID=2599694 RepID=A0A6N8CNM9_9BACI|nr:ABC transporter substrate-binding protein [Terrilactibacillus tamarindi]MTT31180.1 transporter substrate-binding domain-containing protein [Terrilactibacillus tamarindi]